MKGIIVGVDESSYAQAALRWAVDYGACRDLPVTALLAWEFALQHHVDAHAPFDPAYGSETAAGVLDALVDTRSESITTSNGWSSATAPARR